MQSWNDRSSGTDFVWGGFAQVAGGVVISSQESPSSYVLQAFARWDVADDLNGNVGPSTFMLDLDALSAGVMVGFFF